MAPNGIASITISGYDKLLNWIARIKKIATNAKAKAIARSTADSRFFYASPP